MSENLEDISLLCSIKICYLDGKGNMTQSIANPKSFIHLGRNEFRDLVLKLECGKINASYDVKDVTLHTKFFKEGKSTITLKDPPLQIFISNCPTGKLGIFLKTLMAKVEKHKTVKAPSVKERLQSLKPSSFQEISPLTAIDMNVLNNKAAALATKQSTWPQTPKAAKRKHENCGQENNTPNRKIAPIARPIASRLLTNEQKHVLSAVLSGRNVFFTGSAGTGKSFLLKRILGALAPESTFATASTGVAACQIGGITLHSFAGIGTGNAPIQQCIDQVQRKIRTLSWKQCKHLIVDEISMVDGEFFQKLEKIARVVRNNDKPFGGIQLILSGDFLQLPPVSKKGENKLFCFQSSAWDKCIDVNIELHAVKRQSDRNFIQILQDVRKGRSSAALIQKLKSTSNQNIDKDGILATKLSTHKDDVDIINKSHLEQLTGQSQFFFAVDNAPDLSQFINNHCPVGNKLELKVGAQVMLMKNLDLQRGLVNGARGVVLGFDPSKQKLPVVKFACGAKEVINYEKWSFRAHSGMMLVRKMLPLKLAWAMSIHKSQGMTLDCVEVSLARVFECGQAYVALSRARCLDGLRVLDIEPSSIRANAQVLKFYSQLRFANSSEQSSINDYLD
ncbi:ATP-dependent DNA helicase PIF1 [Parasteatoda tepidariorum]|uniref:ATP-dependent DNA helicase PIF1 n=1 Tax=Parasteatoda tepidariorum TaxID=114398 RepID=UPI001C724A3E|nr:ATP-dependent DNA helicase PIF1 [Parasteatoda tepidariorum]